MRQFVFQEEKNFSMIVRMWQALGFHFAIKKEPTSNMGIIAYLLDTSSN